jgi:hypothetical protein
MLHLIQPKAQNAYVFETRGHTERDISWRVFAWNMRATFDNNTSYHYVRGQSLLPVSTYMIKYCLHLSGCINMAAVKQTPMVNKHDFSENLYPPVSPRNLPVGAERLRWIAQRPRQRNTDAKKQLKIVDIFKYQGR